MSAIIVRAPFTPALSSQHNVGIPTSAATSKALWYPFLAGSGTTHNGAFSGQPVASRVVAAGSANASEWTDPSGYTMPTDNGTTNKVYWTANVASDADKTLDDVLTLENMAAGTQIIVACGIQVGTVGAVGAIWAYGKASTANIGYMSVRHKLGNATPDFVYHSRGNAAAGATTVIGTLVSGGQSWYPGQLMAFVTEIEVISSTNINLRWLSGTAANFSAHEALNVDMTQAAAGLPPGKYSDAYTSHLGLTWGAERKTTPDTYLGSGASNTARFGNWCAKRWSTYDSTRLMNIMKDMVWRPSAFPRTMMVGS